MLLAYLRYLSRARDEHSLHSPYLFALYTQVIRPEKSSRKPFKAIQALRKQLSRSSQRITISDFGAGSKVNASRQRTVSDITRHSTKPARFGRLLFRLIQWSGAKNIIDLGTSLGVTTAYLAEATRPYGGRVLTFEGCSETAAIAQQNFTQLGIQNVTVVVGNLNQTLIAGMALPTSIDFVFFDANHRYEPTVRYFETCLSAVHNDTIFVFDDIHWSV